MRNAVILTIQKSKTKAGMVKYWYLRWYGEDGRNHGKCLGRVDKVSKRTANKLLKEKEFEFQKTPGRRSANRVGTIEKYLTLYVESREKELAPGTIALTKISNRYLLKHFGDNRRLDTITRIDAKEFKAALSAGKLVDAQTRSYPNLSPTTVNSHLRIARSIFNHALSDDLILYNPFDRIGKAPAVKRNWHYVTQDEYGKLIRHATPSYKVLIALCRLAGLRRGEALNLEWIDIDFESNRLQVIAKQDWQPKDKDPRIIPICPELLSILLEAQEDAPEGQRKVIVGLGEKNYAQDIYVLFRKAGVTKYKQPLHSLRKSCITDWAAVHPSFVVMAWAGHSDFQTTNDYYLKVSEDEYKSAASKPLFRPKSESVVTQPVTQNEKTEQKSNGDLKEDRSQAVVNKEVTDHCGRPESNRHI